MGRYAAQRESGAGCVPYHPGHRRLVAAATSMLTMPLFALCGSIVAVCLTVFLAMRNGKIPVMTLLLAGVAVGMLLGAITSGILTFMNEQKLQQYLFWMVGGLDYRRWEHVYLAARRATSSP